MIPLAVVLALIAVVGAFWASAVMRVWSRRAAPYWGAVCLAGFPVLVAALMVVLVWWALQ